MIEGREERTTETVTVTIDPEAMQQRNEAAHQMVSDLCHQRREWMMSIPARRDDDPDLVISASLRDVRKLLLAYESVKDEVERLQQLYDLSLFDRSRLEDEVGEVFGIVRRLAAGIGSDPDGTGYRATHTVDVVQDVFEMMARRTGMGGK